MTNYSVTLQIPHLPMSVNQLNRIHWTAKSAEVKKWRKWVSISAKGLAPKSPLKKAKITYTRHSKRQMDFDNLVSTFKATQDGLIDAKIIINDTPEVIGVPTYLWEKTLGTKGWITIHVEGESCICAEQKL